MQTSHIAAPVSLLLLFVGHSLAQDSDPRGGIPSGIVLIGAQTFDAPNESSIRVISSTGEHIRTLFRTSEGVILAGQLSPDRDSLAFGYQSHGGQRELRMLEANGKVSRLLDDGGHLTAWSPDGKQVAFYREAERPHSFDSFVVDVETKRVRKLNLPADYLADDWHPMRDVRTATYLNPRNWFYRESKGDQYPMRQLDLLDPDGSTSPITKDPCTDNIYSRFSPTGDRVLHYQRRLVDDVPYEYAVICDIDGSNARRVLSFRELAESAGVRSYKPMWHPAWSPDGTELAWLVGIRESAASRDLKLELVLVEADGENIRRISLTERGLSWGGSLDWR